MAQETETALGRGQRLSLKWLCSVLTAIRLQLWINLRLKLIHCKLNIFAGITFIGAYKRFMTIIYRERVNVPKFSRSVSKPPSIPSMEVFPIIATTWNNYRHFNNKFLKWRNLTIWFSNNDYMYIRASEKRRIFSAFWNKIYLIFCLRKKGLQYRVCYFPLSWAN